MGNRRIGRKRLYAVEKQGKTIDLEAGAGIEGAIARATQHRQGNELITEIVVDLGTSSQDIEAPGSDTYVIGEDAKPAFVTKMTVAKYGVITEVRAVCLEVPAGGCTDVDLEYASASANGGADPSGTSIMTALTAIGEDTSTAFNANELADKYLYICAGEAGSNADMSAGKFLIYLHGFAVPADL